MKPKRICELCNKGNADLLQFEEVGGYFGKQCRTSYVHTECNLERWGYRKKEGKWVRVEEVI